MSLWALYDRIAQLERNSSNTFFIGSDAFAWSTLQQMPTPRRDLVVAHVNGVIYAIAGEGFPSGYSGACEAYDIALSEWTTKATRPSAYKATGAAIGTTIYTLDGYTDKHYAYSTLMNTWSSKTPPPSQNHDATTTEADGALYVFGGSNTTPGDRCEKYDTATDSWQSRAPMPAKIGYAGSGTVDSIIYVVGGNVSGTAQVTCYAYNPKTNTWSTKAPMKGSKVRPVVVSSGSKLYAIGGAAGNMFEIYDPRSNRWETQADPPASPQNGGGVAINGTLYALGGANSSIPTLTIPVSVPVAYCRKGDIVFVNSSADCAGQNIPVGIETTILQDGPLNVYKSLTGYQRR